MGILTPQARMICEGASILPLPLIPQEQCHEIPAIMKRCLVSEHCEVCAFESQQAWQIATATNVATPVALLLRLAGLRGSPFA